MEKQRVAYLHQRYLNGNLSQQELEEWNSLLEDTESQRILCDLMDANWDKITPDKQIHLKESRSAEIFESITTQTKENKIRLNWSLHATAAAAIILVALSVYFYTVPSSPILKQKPQYSQIVKPGEQGATLTLANGKKIRLSHVSNGEIANEAGISVSKTADGALIYEIKETIGNANKTNTLSTARGETYILTLPDKSRVWLNAASSITYSATLLENGVRRIKLKGEAYFEVTRDALHPFVVDTEGQRIEVLGTHFNVNSYEEEPVTKTTLIEGSVRIVIPKTGKTALLVPGQQSLSNNGHIDVQSIDADEAIAWKNGYFHFDGKNLETALLEVSRWYNVDIEYKGESLRHLALAGSISKYENVNKILKTMELTGVLNFSLVGRKIIVQKN